MSFSLRRFVPLAVSFACLSRTVSAQFSVRHPYPAVDKPVAIAPGDTVQLLNVIVFEPGANAVPPGKRYDVQYQSRLRTLDTIAQRREADRAAQYFGARALAVQAKRLSIALCDNQACAETRLPPRVWYGYELGANGKWKLESVRHPDTAQFFKRH